MSAGIINTNQGSLIALYNLQTNSRRVDKVTAQLGSGVKISRAADDVSGYSIAKTLQTQVRGINRASQNVQDAQGVLEITDSALSTMTDNLQRIRELLVGMASDSNSIDQRNAYAQEVRGLLDDMDRIATATNFNGNNLLDGSATNAFIQIGIRSNATTDAIDITSALAATDSTTLGLVLGPNSGAYITSLNDIFNGTTTQLNSSDAVYGYLQDVDTALASLGARRASVGSFQNQLNRAYDYLAQQGTNLDVARSRIEDTDVAAASAELIQAQVLQKAAVSVLSQSNSTNDAVLQLLQQR